MYIVVDSNNNDEYFIADSTKELIFLLKSLYNVSTTNSTISKRIQDNKLLCDRFKIIKKDGARIFKNEDAVALELLGHHKVIDATTRLEKVIVNAEETQKEIN